ncbi:ATP-binding protein [Rosettibacter firmus]|uniref:DNA polymerase III subunit n=1 Tax=Rosettibacter firmus TaxID=3111522 RepID=UPI00336BE2FB
MNYNWDKVLEQEQAKEILTSFYERRRVPHAFIFNGPEGVGKYFTALQYSQILYSDFSDNIKINAVRNIKNLQEPFVKLIFPLPRAKGETSEDSSIEKLSKEQIELIQNEINKKVINPYYKISIEDANTIKINSIRDIKKFIGYEYQNAPLRFIFIVDADLMNEQTQNALLKSLEEPPKGIIFFLITSNIDKLLPTIQSRCWIVNFNPLSEHAVTKVLIDYFNVNENIARKVAHFSDGSVYKALILLERNLDLLLEKIISVLRYSIGKRFSTAYNELLESLSEYSNEELKVIISLIKIWLNDVIKHRYNNNNFYFVDYKETIEKFNSKFYDADVENLYHKLDVIENYCDKNLNLNVLSLNLIFELASLSIRN